MMKRLVHKLMSRIDPGCEAISRTSSVSLDRRLSIKERWSLFMHLLMCRFCRRYLQQLKALQLISSDLGAEEKSEPRQPVAEMSDAARRRIHQKIADATKKSDHVC